MMRFFRWGYIVPRVIVLLLVVVFSEYGAAWLLKHYAKESGEAAIGARVDIAAAEASIFGTHATIKQIAIADPRQPMINLLEAEQLTLDFDAASAIRKKAVVKQGQLTGLRFGTPRTESGELPNEEEPEDDGSGGFSLPGVAGSMVSEQYLDGVKQRFMADLQLESVRLAKELRQKWPAEYADLETRAKELRDEIDQLTKQVKIARENPLRHVDFLRSLPNKTAELKTELSSLRSRLHEMPQEVRTDRQAVLAARKHDEQLLREKLSFENMDADSLSQYLLGEQIAGPVTELVSWLRWARKLAPSGNESDGQPSRGRDVHFAGCRQTPDLLVQSLRLTGVARLAGRPLEFRGTLNDFTTQPRIHGDPMRLTLSAVGAMPIEVRATINRTGDLPVDELIVDCPTLAIPQLKLGKPDVLGLSVAPSTASLSISLMLKGQQLSGDLQLVQRDVHVTPHVKQSLGDVLANANLERALTRKLSQTPQLVTSVTLSGDLEHPKWKVWSTAGPAVAEAMNTALRDVANQQAQGLLAKGDQAVAAELGALDGEIRQLTARVTTALGEPAQALEGLIGSSGTGGIGAIGSRLAPVGSLFK